METSTESRNADKLNDMEIEVVKFVKCSHELPSQGHQLDLSSAAADRL